MATPLEWALGLALDSLLKYLGSKIFSKDLPSKLEKEVEKWSKELPPELQFHYEALFGEITADSDIEKFPKLFKLREVLKQYHIPESATWFEALFERWQYVSSIHRSEETPPFFKQSPEEAEQQLYILAQRLTVTCKKDEELARVTTVDRIGEILAGVNHLGTYITSRKETTTTYSTLVFEALGIQLEKLSSALSKEKAQHLEEYRELYREGQVNEAYTKVLELRHDEHWKTFEKSLQAKILRILASYTLNVKRNIDSAKELVEEASAIDPEADDIVIRVLLQYYSSGAKTALTFLDEPLNIDSFNLKLALLLEIGQIDDLLICLKNKQSHINENAETKRLHALALLLKKKIADAEVEIKRAIYEKPKWEGVRIAAAIVNYYSALSPSLLPDRFIAWPEPVSFPFIRCDDDSIAKLKKAESLFRELLETPADDTPKDTYLEIWRLACLANDSERQVQAKEFCQEILSKNPENPFAIIWALSCNFDIDMSFSENALKSVAVDSKDYYLKILALLDLYLTAGKIQESLELLQKTKSKFVEEGIVDTWLIWHAKVLVENSQSEDALHEAEIAKNSEVQTYIRTMALREIVRKSDNWNEFIRHLEDSFNRTENIQFLYECCQIKAQIGEWGYIIDHIDRLIEGLNTHAAIELAAKAAWQANKPELCLKTLNDNSYMFTKGILPDDLFRLRVYCQSRLGFLPKALTEAEALFKENDSTENLLTLMEMQFRKGDLKSLADSASILLNRQDAIPPNLLRAARLTLIEEPQLAKTLWQRAAKEGEDDPSCVKEALEIGYRLGLDKELDFLLTKMHEFSSRGEGSIKIVDLQSLLTMIQENRKRAEFVNEKYNSGEIPVHLLSETLNVPLVNIYHSFPGQNSLSPDTLRQHALLIRHGGRPAPMNLSNEQRKLRLHVDISALLLASHIGILDKIEQMFKPLRISSILPAALIHQIERVTEPQPARRKGYEQIIELLEQQKLGEISPANYSATDLQQNVRYLIKHKGKDWVLLLERAITEKGCVVDFLPLRSRVENNLVKLSGVSKDHVINCRSLIKSLRKSGVISEERYLKILNDLGNLGHEKPMGLLPTSTLGSNLYVSSAIACELAIADALSLVCQQFKVFIDKDSIEEARQEVKEHARRQELVVWIKGLLARITRGLDNGDYEMMTLPEDKKEQGDRTGPEFITALDLLKFNPQEGDVIWVDDRFFNSYVHRDGAPIVGVFDILSWLKKNTDITKNEYYEKILQLRASNFRYVPITADEIIYHLKQASVIEGSIVETGELSIIRRYIASCLLDSHRLQIPPLHSKTANPNGEISFVTSTMRAVTNAIVRVWKDESIDEKTAANYADWILINLYVGTFGIRHLRKETEPDDDGIDLIGLDIGSLFSLGISFNSRLLEAKENGNKRRKKYFQWIENRLVKNRFRADPGAVVATERSLNYLLSDMVNKLYENKTLEMVSKKLVQELYLDLPESIKKEIRLSPDIMEWMGIQTVESIKIGDFWFPAYDFWFAVKEALNGKQMSVKKLGMPDELFLRMGEVDAEKKVIEIRDNRGEIKGILNDPMVYLLSDNPDEQRKTLIVNRYWFDCGGPTLEKIINDIISTEDFAKRLKKVDDWRKKSTAVFYRDLKKEMESGHFVFEKLLPSSLAGILQYFRLVPRGTEKEEFARIIEESGQILFNDEGLEEALNRLSCLPIRLPAFLRDKVNSLPIDEKKNLLTKLEPLCASPICKIHLIDLAFHCSEDRDFLINFGRKMVDELLDNDIQFALFRSILLWVHDEFSYSAEVREWPTSIKLVMFWAHANMLHNLFISVGATPAELTKIFESQHYGISSEILDRESLFWNDILHPFRINKIVLLMAIAKILQDKDAVILHELRIVEKIKDYISRKIGEDQLPEILRNPDTSLFEDSTGSLFSGNRATILSFGDSEMSSLYSSENLKSIVQSSIKSLLSNQQQPDEWLKIYAIVNDLPIYEDLGEAFSSLLKKLDISSLKDKSPLSAIMALRVATKQVVNIGDEQMRVRLTESLMQLAVFFAKLQDSEKALTDASILSAETIATGIIDDALSLSIRPNSPRETSREFSKILGNIFNVWPLTAQKLGYGIFRLAHELPAQQLHGFWPLILTWRASSR